MRARLNVLLPDFRNIEAAESYQVVLAVLDVSWHLDLPTRLLISSHLIVVSRCTVEVIIHRCICDGELIEERVVCLPGIIGLEQRNGCLVDATASIVDVVDLKRAQC